jgi:hypothetical protein
MISLVDVLIAFGCVGFIALLGVYCWDELGRLIAEQLREDETSTDDGIAFELPLAAETMRD